MRSVFLNNYNNNNIDPSTGTGSSNGHVLNSITWREPGDGLYLKLTATASAIPFNFVAQAAVL